MLQLFSIAVPGPVRLLQVISQSDTSVQIAWNSPAGVNEITSYEVSVSQWSDGVVIQRNTIDPTTAFLNWIVSGLSEF